MAVAAVKHLRESYTRIIDNTLTQLRETGLVREMGRPVADELGRRWRAAAERELALMEAAAGGGGGRRPQAEAAPERAPKRRRAASIGSQVGIARPSAAAGAAAATGAASAPAAAAASAPPAAVVTVCSDSDDEYEGVFDDADTVVASASRPDAAAPAGVGAASLAGPASSSAAVSRKRKTSFTAEDPVPGNPVQAAPEDNETVLGSDDACSDFDEPHTNNVIQGPVLSLRRSKRRWSMQLGHGMLRVAGVESLFSSVQAIMDLEEDHGPDTLPASISELDPCFEVDLSKTGRTNAERQSMNGTNESGKG